VPQDVQNVCCAPFTCWQVGQRTVWSDALAVPVSVDGKRAGGTGNGGGSNGADAGAVNRVGARGLAGIDGDGG
jgi:hypothetical protein